VANGKYKYAAPAVPVAKHFITADVTGPLELGCDTGDLYVLSEKTEVLAEREGSPQLAVHGFGQGRSVYLSGLKFSPENTRLLHRALFWAAAQEAKWGTWQSANVRTEATWFAKAGKLVVINNAGEPQETVVTLGDGRASRDVRLEAHGIAIIDVKA
jgi:beta-D-galactosyl-(1->4)-L-rhamnose phosphorylase